MYIQGAKNYWKDRCYAIHNWCGLVDQSFRGRISKTSIWIAIQLQVHASEMNASCKDEPEISRCCDFLGDFDVWRSCCWQRPITENFRQNENPRWAIILSRHAWTRGAALSDRSEWTGHKLIESILIPKKYISIHSSLSLKWLVLMEYEWWPFSRGQLVMQMSYKHICRLN